MDKLSELYRSVAGCLPESVTPLAGAGSNRRYFLLDGKKRLIGTAGTDVRENDAFVYMSAFFAKMGLPVPEVLAVSNDGMAYLQTFAGGASLFDILASARESGEYSARQRQLLKEAVRLLARFHSASFAGFDFGKCVPREAMDYRSVMWDLNYFKYSFLKVAGIAFDEDALENDFEKIAGMAGDGDSIILRDCQSRNIMVDEDDNLTFIDFQGARRGNGMYDLVSLLWQARAALPSELKKELVEEYITARGFSSAAADDFRRQLPLFVLLRTLQVLGAYGFRGLIERKEHFVRSIPAAMDNVREILAGGIDGLPELGRVLGMLAADSRFNRRTLVKGELTVKVWSFAYKMGMPADDSGNGGGYVFDCRAIHNPGRYDEYKPLTGRDSAVIEFLESNGEVQPFLEHALALVDSSVEKYIKRGFTSLTVAFGCTGGRHRSVCCAEKCARHISEKFGVRVELCHREQGITEIFEKK